MTLTTEQIEILKAIADADKPNGKHDALAIGLFKTLLNSAAENDRLTDALKHLDFGGEGDVIYNLIGVSVDLAKGEKADDVCLETIERVINQIASFKAALNPQEKSK